jgi:tetratricopeptide (TPR) repeat protein
VWADKDRLWDDVLAKYPDSAVARDEIGLRLLNSGRLDEAERELLASLRLMPNYVYTYVLLGMTYAKRGDMARAIDAYRTALEFRPSYVEARIRLGLAYEAQGLMDDALAEYDRAIRDDPWASPALVFAAAILEQRGEIDEALARLKRVAPDDPIYDDAQLRLGELLLRLERWAEAREAFAAHLARVPQSREARYYLELMDARERQGLPAGSATGAGGS